MKGRWPAFASILFLFTSIQVSAMDQAAVYPEGVIPGWSRGGGTVALIGGDWHASDPRIFRAIREFLAKGDRAAVSAREGSIPIAVVCSGNQNLRAACETFHLDDPEDPAGSPSYKTWFGRMGFRAVFIPIASDRPAGTADSTLRRRLGQLVSPCRAVFFTGGDQARHAASLLTPEGLDTPFLAAVRRIFERGGLVMGTSAGTHAMSRTMFGWGQSYETLLYNRLEEKLLSETRGTKDLEPSQAGNCFSLPSLGFLPEGVLTDSHFDARGRFGRLLVGMRDTRCSVGIGVDENTALFVKGGKGTAVGGNGVFIIEAGPGSFLRGDRSRKASPSGRKRDTSPSMGDRSRKASPAEAPPSGRESCTPPSLDGRFRARGLRVTYLSDGDSFDFPTGRIVTARLPFAPQEVPPTGLGRDIFSSEFDAEGNRKSPYGVTAVLRRLAIGAEDSVLARTHERRPTFVLRFSRNGETQTFLGTDGRFCVFRAALDVEPAEGD